ncbi:reverse transcriptase family protein [Agrobacterium tumefaciens]|uniref:hypothetical protein n=1 Tax=Agrobacterium tumefaciens TaxID=358 RepID=UPI00097884CD|nr:hypothetical protein BV900_27760 [Agrobacterium tumefaciens]
MMNGHEKSDSAIVAVNPTNNTREPVAEPRAGTKGNANEQSTRRAQDRESMSQALERVRNAARQRKTERFTALYHHITPELLRMSFYALRRGAAAGADGVRWQDYEADLDTNIKALHERVHRGTYRAQPSRRRFIPKADGRLRPLAVTAIEDKIVQRATIAVLNGIYE